MNLDPECPCWLTATMSEYKRVYFEATGRPECELKVQSVTSQPLADGEIRVKMKAAPVNPADINFVQGVYGLKPVLPSGAGLEGVGVVEESRSSAFQSGDSVIRLAGIGSWSEYAVGSAEQFLKVRADLPAEQAAMLKVNPLTAYRVLVGFADLKPGDWVVQNAANSGVGRCLIQIARAMGLKTINLVRREELIPELLALGADVVLLDAQGAADKMLEATGGVKPRLASNCVGGDSALRLMDMLAPRGKMVTFGAMSKQSLKVPNGFLIFKRIELLGLWVTEWLKEATRDEVVAAYARLADWMAEGKLTQAIDAEYSLDQITEAVTRAQQESRDGKILLKIS